MKSKSLVETNVSLYAINFDEKKIILDPETNGRYLIADIPEIPELDAMRAQGEQMMKQRNELDLQIDALKEQLNAIQAMLIVQKRKIWTLVDAQINPAFRDKIKANQNGHWHLEMQNKEGKVRVCLAQSEKECPEHSDDNQPDLKDFIKKMLDK